MKIAVVGSHGTGKTTLCKGIVDAYGFSFIPDVVRDAFELKFEVNETTPPETQFWILSKQIELERNTPESWVSEKSLWDNIVYGEYAISDVEVNRVIRKIVISNANYDLVFYCPIEFPIPDDGLRSLNGEFQKTIDKKLRQLMKSNAINFIQVRGSKKDRIDKVKRIINYRLKEKPSEK